MGRRSSDNHDLCGGVRWTGGCSRSIEGRGLNEASGLLCRSAGGKSAAVSPSDPHCVEVPHRAHAYSIIDLVTWPYDSP